MLSCCNRNMVHVAAQPSFQLGVCLGNGDGTFRAGPLISTTIAGSLGDLAVLDVNNDGHQVWMYMLLYICFD
jgi:hypothetical protein